MANQIKNGNSKKQNISLTIPSTETESTLKTESSGNIKFNDHKISAIEKIPSNLHIDDIEKFASSDTNNEIGTRNIAKTIVNAGYLTANIAKTCIFDFYDSTLECFKSIQLASTNDVRKTATESVKKISGGLALAAILAQLNVANITSLTESITGRNIPDSSINAITKLLNTKGVQLLNMSKKELADLSVSFLHLLRNHHTDLSLGKSILSTTVGDLNVNVSNVNLKNIRTSHNTKNDSDSTSVEADELEFSLEISSPDKTPDKLIIKMNGLKLEGESNLFTLLGNTISETIVSIGNTFQPVQDADKKTPLPIFIPVKDAQQNNETVNYFTHIDAQSISILVESTGELCQNYGLSKDTDITVHGIHASSGFNTPEENIDVNIDEFRISNIAIDKTNTIINADIKLDDNLNGEFIAELKLDYETFNNYFPKVMPSKLKSYIIKQKGAGDKNHFVNIKLAVDIADGVIDLNTLIASSATAEEANKSQHYIRKVVLNCLNSKKTRIKQTDTETKLKINIPAFQRTNTEYIKKDKQKMQFFKKKFLQFLATPVQLKTFYPLDESYTKYLESDPTGRGKISLISMLENQGYTMKQRS